VIPAVLVVLPPMESPAFTEDGTREMQATIANPISC